MKINKNFLRQVILEELNFILEGRIHQLLDLPTNSSAEDVRKAYLKKAAVIHPDKNPDNLQDATNQTAELNAAYKNFQNGVEDTDDVFKVRKISKDTATEPDLILRGLTNASFRENDKNKKLFIQQQIDSFKNIIKTNDQQKIEQIGIAYEKYQKEKEKQRIAPEPQKNPKVLNDLYNNFIKLLNITQGSQQAKQNSSVNTSGAVRTAARGPNQGTSVSRPSGRLFSTIPNLNEEIQSMKITRNYLKQIIKEELQKEVSKYPSSKRNKKDVPPAPPSGYGEYYGSPIARKAQDVITGLSSVTDNLIQGGEDVVLVRFYANRIIEDALKILLGIDNRFSYLNLTRLEFVKGEQIKNLIDDQYKVFKEQYQNRTEDEIKKSTEMIKNNIKDLQEKAKTQVQLPEIPNI